MALTPAAPGKRGGSAAERAGRNGVQCLEGRGRALEGRGCPALTPTHTPTPSLPLSASELELSQLGAPAVKQADSADRTWDGLGKTPWRTAQGEAPDQQGSPGPHPRPCPPRGSP